MATNLMFKFTLKLRRQSVNELKVSRHKSIGERASGECDCCNQTPQRIKSAYARSQSGIDVTTCTPPTTCHAFPLAPNTVPCTLS